MRSTVRDVMTTRVLAVRQDASFKQMISKMRQAHISGFPVIDDAGRVIGVVSEADLLSKEADQAAAAAPRGTARRLEHEKAAGVTAGDLMTSPPVTIGPDEPVTAAARLMADRRIRRLPVISDSGHLIGVVSRADVLSVFTRSDRAIRAEVTGEVIRGFLADPVAIKVTVRDGIVTLSGIPGAGRAGLDLVEAVRHVEGVVSVRDGMG